VIRKGADLHLHRTQDLPYHNDESGVGLYWQNQRMQRFLTITIRILSGIGPRNALSQ
jgi:hypothetical protein